MFTTLVKVKHFVRCRNQRTCALSGLQKWSQAFLIGVGLCVEVLGQCIGSMVAPLSRRSTWSKSTCTIAL